MTMTDDIGTPLLAAINLKDTVATMVEILKFKANMRNPEIGASFVIWITEPVNLTNIHKALIENLNIPPRLLAIKRSAISRTQKSVLLFQAIENAVKRVHGL